MLLLAPLALLIAACGHGTGAKAAAGSSAASGSSASATSTVAPAPTTVVPAPSQGTIRQTVSTSAVPTKPAVTIDKPASFGANVSAAVVSTKLVDMTARIPGEISGQAAAFTVSITNKSSKPISVAEVTVVAYDKTNAPLVEMSGAPRHPFSGTLAAGQTAQGVYVFSLHTTSSKVVSLTVSYASDQPVVRFVGTVK